MGQNPVPLVNIKIGGTCMFNPPQNGAHLARLPLSFPACRLSAASSAWQMPTRQEKQRAEKWSPLFGRAVLGVGFSSETQETTTIFGGDQGKGVPFWGGGGWFTMKLVCGVLVLKKMTHAKRATKAKGRSQT